MTNKEIALKVADILDNKKGNDIVILDVSQNTSYADYFVIVSGNSDRQVETLAEEVDEVLFKEGVRLINQEGKNSGWVLLDFGDIIVHIFLEEQRRHYNLEKLWSDSIIVER